MKNEEKILVSWFYMYHGLAFFKHILSAFSINKPLVEKEGFKEEANISQHKMQEVFDKNLDSLAYVFDKIYILYPSAEVYKKHIGKTYDFRKISLLETDEEIKQTQTSEIWKDIIEKEFTIQQEFEYIQKKYPKKAELLYSQYWRNIHHYLPEEQIWWLMNKSNLPEEYKNRFEFINMNDKYKFDDFWNYQKIAEVTYNMLSSIEKRHKNANYYINVALASREVQIVWFALSQGGFLPHNTVLFESYDVKSSIKERFKDFFIRTVPLNILDQIKAEIALFKTKPIGKKRQIAEELFKSYLKQGFAITLMGERGIGKTNIIKSFSEKGIVIVDCQVYENDDILAEKQIFGYKMGTSKLEQGFFHKAGGKIIVFDEVAKLSKNMQSRLMQALITDKNNYFHIRPMGISKIEKIKTTVLFTTSYTVNDLRDRLLPALFDRIMQLVIELPSLRDTPEEIPQAFEETWKQLLFDRNYNFSNTITNEMLNWLKTLPLEGNYRDLQRIAIFYKSYLDFDVVLKELLKEKTAFEYTKAQYEKYIKPEKTEKIAYFQADKTSEFMIKQFKKDLANWLIKRFGSAQKAVEHLKNLDEKITKETLYHWRK